MPCGCGKKNTGTVHFMGKVSTEVPDPIEWGPIIWKYLHCIIEKIGFSGNPLVDNDQAGYMEILIGTLHQIIPCTECQAHASAYILGNPLPTLRGLKGNELRDILRNWLFNFHNHVRNSKGQPIPVPKFIQKKYRIGHQFYYQDPEFDYYSIIPIMPTGWINVKVDMEIVKRVKRYAKTLGTNNRGHESFLSKLNDFSKRLFKLFIFKFRSI